jgi:hypothetical protein
VFIDAEDYLPVRSTYPEHPDTKPKVREKKELDELRKKEYK